MRWTRALRGGVGDPLGFKANPAIEKWAKFKEDYHIRFQWTPQRVFDVLLWGFTVPFCVYKVFVYEQIRVEKQNGRDGEHHQFLAGPK